MKLKLLVVTLFLLLPVSAMAQGKNDQPTPFDIVMMSGADYQLSIKNTDANGAAINLTGYQYASQFRSAPSPAGVLFATYSTSIVSAAAGEFKIELSRTKTRALSGNSGVWDLLQIDATGKETYLLSGRAAVLPSVTRRP
jgi:hypothetical protein